MPNIAAIYNDAIRVKSEEDEPKKSSSLTSKDPVRIQSEINWQNSTITKEFFSSLEQRINELETQARNNAVAYPQTKNHESIVQALIRSDELRKILTTYGTNK